MIPRIYGQPKIHEQIYPLREIVDGSDGVTKEVNTFIAKIIEPLIDTKTKHYITNSVNFL